MNDCVVCGKLNTGALCDRCEESTQGFKFRLRAALIKWFSWRIFLATLLVTAGWNWLGISYRDANSSVAMAALVELILMAPLTGVLLLCATANFGAWGYSSPDYTRKWYQCSGISSKTWVSMAVGVLPVTATLIFLTI
jgi:hypothetical protein